MERIVRTISSISNRETDAAICKKLFGSGTTIIISSEKMSDFMKKLSHLKTLVY